MNIMDVKFKQNYFLRNQLRNEHSQLCINNKNSKKDILNDNIATICLCDNFVII